MMIRIVAGTLLVALLALQYRLWVSGSGMREVWRLEQAIATQQQENDGLEASATARSRPKCATSRTAMRPSRSVPAPISA